MTDHGPLYGIRVLEIAGLGPVPFCGMVLADLGADVVRIDRSRPTELSPAGHEVLGRGKRSIAVDLKEPIGVETTLALAERADIMFEGFRPGVVETLGIGPDRCLQRNPRLVYGRMTGWGQEGPLSLTAGHDISYIALSGALHAIGDSDRAPQIPLGLVGDFAGALYLTAGLLSALHEARSNGHGQVVDAAVVDGSAHLMTMFYGLLAGGSWQDERGVNLVDGGAPFYSVYATADNKYMAVGAIEPKFFRELAATMEIDVDFDHFDRSRWDELRQLLSEAFIARTQDEWTQAFEGTDCCVAPVLSMSDAPRHPHLAQRNTFIELDGITQPAPTPRFSRTQGTVGQVGCVPVSDSQDILGEWDD